jgi:hypothetical protein
LQLIRCIYFFFQTYEKNFTRIGRSNVLKGESSFAKQKVFSNQVLLTGWFEMGMKFDASGANMNKKRTEPKWVERNS